MAMNRWSFATRLNSLLTTSTQLALQLSRSVFNFPQQFKREQLCTDNRFHSVPHSIGDFLMRRKRDASLNRGRIATVN